MHGAGNDFVVLDGIRDALPPLEPLARRLGDRHFGIGFDQLLVVRPVARRGLPHGDLQRGRLAGGDVRERDPLLLQVPARRGPHRKRRSSRVETLSGVVTPRWAGPGRVTVDMGPPILAPAKIPTRLGDPAATAPCSTCRSRVDGQELLASRVSMGNPHCVVYVDDVEPRRSRRSARSSSATTRSRTASTSSSSQLVSREPRASAHLGARRRRDARLRQRCVRDRRGLDPARRRGRAAARRAARRRPRDRLGRRRARACS